jgi:transposase
MPGVVHPIRLDTALLMRAFLGWLRGEPEHCRMAAIPSLEQEDDKRPSREREHLVGERTRLVNRLKAALARLGIRGFKPTLKKAAERLDALRTPDGKPIPLNMLLEMRRDLERLRLIREQIAAIEAARLQRLAQAPATGPDAMVRLLARVRGLGVETADMLVREILARDLRDRRAVARYAGLTGTPDESGRRRREGPVQGRQCSGAAGHGPAGLALPAVPKGQPLARWYRTRTDGARGGVRKVLIVALARKLLVDLWRLVTAGQVPQGVVLQPA